MQDVIIIMKYGSLNLFIASQTKLQASYLLPTTGKFIFNYENFHCNLDKVKCLWNRYLQLYMHTVWNKYGNKYFKIPDIMQNEQSWQSNAHCFKKHDP
jgi:hypothetical protein